jgi:phosphoribosylformylglycinamidine cyclo-ligase
METKGGDVLTFSNSNLGAAEGPSMATRQDVYKGTGVDTAEADAGLRNIIRRVERTWPRQGMGRVILRIGYFANVIEMDGVGIAMCTDGVGTKTIIADLMGKYDTIGVDCVAMNVNDMICVGAKPLSLVDYIAVDHVDATMLDAIAAGLCEGADMAGISISGGETSQLKDIVTGFDLVGTAMGRVDLDKVICGKDVADGDIVIGVKSNGVHSNGLSLARKAFFNNAKYGVNHKFEDLDTTLGEELLRPTHI